MSCSATSTNDACRTTSGLRACTPAPAFVSSIIHLLAHTARTSRRSTAIRSVRQRYQREFTVHLRYKSSTIKQIETIGRKQANNIARSYINVYIRYTLGTITLLTKNLDPLDCVRLQLGHNASRTCNHNALRHLTSKRQVLHEFVRV